MPDIYGPFDPDLDVNGDPIPGTGAWAQDQWYRYSPTWAPSGVVGSAASATSPSAGSFGLTVSGMDISLSLGRAWVYGAGYERTSTPWTATIPPNTNTNPLMAALVLRRDLAVKTLLPTVIYGTPAATPVAPTRQQNEAGQWDLPLHTFIVPANSGAPLTSVVDNRVWVDTQSSNYVVTGSSGGGQILAHGSMATSQITTTTNSRVIGGLSVTPTLSPGRIYEAEWSGAITAQGSNSTQGTLTIRAIAGSTAPTSANGSVVGSALTADLMSAVATGKFTVGTAGVYAISPFIVTNFTGATLGPVTGGNAMTLVIRDAGPATGVPGTTPIAVP